MYHEDKNGRRTHYNGQRLGKADPIIKPDDDSPFWQVKATDTLYALIDAIGEKEYKAWWERTFECDGKTADNFTWKEINTAATIALEHPETLECSCNGIGEPCEICKSNHTESVLPF